MQHWERGITEFAVRAGEQRGDAEGRQSGRSFEAIALPYSPPADGDRGRGWGHTAADTRDKGDPRTLREHAMLTAPLVCELTHADVPRIDISDLRDRLDDLAHKPGIRAANIWPVDWD